MFRIVLLLFSAIILQACAYLLRKEGCGPERACAYPSCGDNACHIYAYNRNSFPVTMAIDITAENLRHRKDDSGLVVLHPNEKRRVKRLNQRDPASGYSLTVSSRWIMGSYLSIPDTQYVYRLPFREGKACMVGQGYHGKATHQGPLAYAVDFNMEIGDTITAARGGVVVQVEDRHVKGCPQVECAKYGNSVEILHEDGTIASYSHLKKNGALVKVGDTVVVGQKIGLSGATGRVTGPHLHFIVAKTISSTEYQSIPVIFSTNKGNLKELKEAEEYSH